LSKIEIINFINKYFLNWNP